MPFTLDTPAQIAMWVLLSRRSQLKMQLGLRPDGSTGVSIPTKGLVKWCRNNIPGCESARYARDCVVPVEYAIAEAGGPQDFSVINVLVVRTQGDMGMDAGILSNMEEVAANEGFAKAYKDGRLNLIYTMDQPRPANGQFYVVDSEDCGGCENDECCGSCACCQNDL